MGNPVFESVKNHRILIVDDNPHNLQVLGRLLQEEKYEIEFSTNGKAALEWLEIQEFDLVLLDINMPEIDGFEVCKKIRSDERLNKVPVIFLTADTDRESVLKGFDMGAQDYITKPFDSRELIVRVKTHLSLKESHDKLEKANKYLEEKVTERTIQLKNANEKLEKMNQKLTDLDKAKSDFLNLISHEIRTPLNGIVGPLELLKDPLQSAELGELFDILDSSVNRLENFATNALLITCLKTHPYDIAKNDVSFENLITEVVDELKSSIDKKQLTIKRKKSTSLEKFQGNNELVKKCLYNIISNAVTYSPECSSIEIITMTEEDHLVITIKDNGKGIPKKIMESDFELFSRGGDYRESATGIGLPLASLIMEAHKGKIELKNKSEGGASVTLRFRLS